MAWFLQGHFLQAISLLLVIGLMLVLFAWLVRAFQLKPEEAEEQSDPISDPIGHTKYTDDDYIGLD